MINKLTPEQVAKFPEYVKKWISIGLSCEPCDMEKAKKAATRAYELAGKKPPSWWFVFDSPLSAAIAASMIKQLFAMDQVMGQSWAQVLDQVWAQVRDQVGNQVRAQVRDQVGDQVWDQVGDQVWDQVRDQVGNQVRAQVRDQVGNQVRAQVRDQVGDQVRDQVRDQVYGSHDSGWLSFYDYLRNEIPLVMETDKLTGLLELAEECGWWSPYENVCIFQHRHCEVHFDADGRLHNDRGMACRYRDGFGVWALGGIRLDEQIIMAPGTQTIEQINQESNQDVRAIRIERFGWSRYIRESSAKCIDNCVNEISNTPEALYELNDGAKRFVAGCVTAKLVTMGVPSEIKTCQEAQRWLAGGKKWNLIAAT